MAGAVEPDVEEPHATLAPARDRYGMLVLALSALYIAAPFLSRWPAGRVAQTGLMTGVLVLALRESHVANRWVVRAALAGLGLTAIALFSAIVHRQTLESPSLLAFAALVAVTFGAIINRVLRHRLVSSSTVMGAVAAYILLGIFFASLYQSVQDISQQPFFAPGQADQGFGSPADFSYFSFVTLTTVGFGDLTAASNAWRPMVVAEAMLGQLLLVTFVGRLVGSIGVTRDPAAPSPPRRFWPRPASTTATEES